MKFYLLAIFLLFFSNFLNAQQSNSKWDTTKQFYQKFELSPRQKKMIEFKIPSGTKELLYRITILENGGNITNSLANILSAVPYTPAKLLGNSVNLLNGIGGSSKCEYLIFNTKEKANLYIKDKNNLHLACYRSEKIIEHFNVLNSKIGCLKGVNSIFLVINSDNWIEKSSVVIEAIPNVDVEIANGWNTKNKTTIIDNCKKINNKPLENVAENCVCVYSKFKFNTVSQYNALLPEERNNLLINTYQECSKKSSINETLISNEYIKAKIFYNDKKYDSSIVVLDQILKINNSHVNSNHLLAKCYLMTKQFTKALSVLSKLNSENTDNLAIKLDYAHALLLNDKFDDAKQIYSQHKKENINTQVSWVEQLKIDFNMFQNNGIESNKYTKILNLIE